MAAARGWALVGIVIGFLRDLLRLCGSRRDAILNRMTETCLAHEKIYRVVFVEQFDENSIRSAVEDHIGTWERWKKLLIDREH